MVSILSGTGKALGIISVVILASIYGTDKAVDAFYLALVLPQMFFSWTRSPVRVSFLPIFTFELESKDENTAWEAANVVNSNLIVIFAILTGLLIMLAPSFVSLLAPGFDAELKTVASTIARLVLVIFLLNNIDSLIANISYSHQRFALPAARPIVNNIIIIVFVLLFHRTLGIYALVWGVILGAFGRLAIMLPEAWSNRSLISFKPDFKHPMMRKVTVLGLPVVAGMMAAKIDIFVDRLFASKLAEGSISALAYAERIIALPTELVFVSFTLVLFPFFCKFAGKKEFSKLSEGVLVSIKILFSVIFPASIGLALLAIPIVQLIFQRGAFDEQSAEYTSTVLLFLSFGLAPVLVSQILLPAYQSLQRTKTPVAVGFARVALKIGLTMLLVRQFQLAGLAMATSISHLFKLIVLMAILPSELWANRHKEVLLSFGKTMLATVPMAMCVYFAFQYLDLYLNFSPVFACLALKLLLASLTGLTTYILSSYLVSNTEIIDITKMVYEKVFSIFRHAGGQFMRDDSLTKKDF